MRIQDASRTLAVCMSLLAFGYGCGTALQPVATTGAILYTQGARQHTAMLQISLPSTEVYAGLLRVVEKRPDLKVINKNDKRLFVEVEKNGQNLSAQATSLAGNETLLFIWADTGASGRAGRDLTQIATEAICNELGVQCKVKEN